MDILDDYIIKSKSFHLERKRSRQKLGMGSLGEEELVQMVQDFIESESASPSNANSSNIRSYHLPSQKLIVQRTQDILGSEAAAEAKVRDFAVQTMKNKHKGKTRETEKTTAQVRKWLAVQLKTSGFDACLCQTTWPSSMGCPAGAYEYIDVKFEDENANSMRLIVDIDFRSQFELARPTETYKHLTDTLPVIFVGTESKLSRIISLLCSAAKQSLRERGLHVPPWRTIGYMQSKWLSSCRKIPVDVVNAGLSGDTSMEDKDCVQGIGKWVLPTPTVKPKRRSMGGGSGLSRQFSDMSIHCC